MSREYETPFDFVESEPVGRALDCLGPRQTAGPFHYLINEQAKSLLALQELQHEVGALLEFRDLVIETFPSLKTKLSSPSSSSHNSSQTIARTDWVPGVRVRRKLGTKKNDAVPDSGFSTETSSKEAHSASSTAMVTTSAGTTYDTDDELWSLLDVIHRKGTRLKDEVETLQGHLQNQSPSQSEEDFQKSLFRSSAEDVRQIRRERDSLMARLAEMEAEVIASRIQTSKLQEDFEQLLNAKQDVEQQLRNVLNQRGEVNSRIHDLHSQFVAKQCTGQLEIGNKTKTFNEIKSDQNNISTSSHENLRTSCTVLSDELDKVLGDKIPKVNETDSKKISAILSEKNPIVLQKHLLTSTVQNEILMKQLESASRLEVNLVDKLDKFREENEELRIELEDKNIQLEGTRARVRILEQLQKPLNSHSNPDVIPTSTLNSTSSPSRGEILSDSMKNMSPIPMALQVDHSSSTESAHDQTESNRRNLESAKRKPSRIPLKSYTAPKPPGRGKAHQSATSHGARSRSGDSPGRPHSSHSSRGGGSKSENGSLHGSVTSKDSLSSKLRGSDSLSRLSTASVNSLRKNSSPIVKWSNGGAKDQTTSSVDKVRPKTTSFWNFFKLRDSNQS